MEYGIGPAEDENTAWDGENHSPRVQYLYLLNFGVGDFGKL
jgi:hypothetical protein